MSARSRQTNEQMKAASRDRILASARTLFAEKGYFACRMADIAARAGMSAGNVYWRFDSKEAILKAILADGFGALESMTAEVAEAPGTGRDKVSLLVERTIGLYDTHAEFAVILATLLGRGGQELIRSLGFDMAAIGGRYHANLARVFAQARQEGSVADVEPDLLVACFF
ncbi:MAG: helix-turn-helix domain-containing protein, partial [Candidatus Limnocylindrales bacterium]